MVVKKTLVSVASIMNREPPTVDKDANLKHALEVMGDYESDRVLVVEEKELVGIVSKKDVMVRLATLRTRTTSLARLYVSSVMTGNPITTTLESLVDKVVRVMVEADIASIPVVEASSKKVLGLITRFEVGRLALEEDVEVSSIARPITSYLREYSTILQARKLLIDSNLSIIPVLGDGRVVRGVVTVDDVADALTTFYDVVPVKHRSERLSRIQVSDIMSKSPITFTPGESLGGAVEKLLRVRVKGGVVVERGEAIGLLTLADVVKYLSTTF